MLQESPLTYEAVIYTWRQLAQRAGVTADDPNGTGFEALNTPIFYGYPDQFNADRPGIIVVPAPPEAWHRVLSLPFHSLTWLPADKVMPPGQPLPVESTIPVLFWGQGYEDDVKPFVEQLEDGSIIFYADIIAAAFFMLSRWEETVIEERDEHERFPATASVAYKQDFLDRPIVDEYALVLQAWLKHLKPGWQPQKQQFQVRLSHDIDHIYRFNDIRHWFRVMGGDLLKRRNLTLAWQAGQDGIIELVNPSQSPYLRRVNALANLSAKYSLHSSFYFMTARPAQWDGGYDIAAKPVQTAITKLREMGSEIGFHAGYHTLNDPDRLAEEKARLDSVLGYRQYGGRQHYLRFKVPDTWRHWEQVGLTYDSTMGYPTRPGFRCGTCYPFSPFDLQDNRELFLQEFPLVVMDKTLSSYLKLTPQQGLECILALAQRCKQVGGVFTLLWHNSIDSYFSLEWMKTYQQALETLSTTSN